jgi:hypothetical protein
MSKVLSASIPSSLAKGTSKAAPYWRRSFEYGLVLPKTNANAQGLGRLAGAWFGSAPASRRVLTSATPLLYWIAEKRSRVLCIAGSRRMQAVCRSPVTISGVLQQTELRIKVSKYL